MKSTSKKSLAALAALGAAACVAAAPGDTPTPMVEAAPGAALVASQPVTVRLDAPEELWSELHRIAAARDGQARTLRLSLDGVEAVREAVGIRVFLNLPDPAIAASMAEPLDDPHFVGSVAFFEGGDFGSDPTRTFLLNAGPCVQQLAALGGLSDEEPLRVTLVAVPLRPEVEIASVRIPIETVRLSVH